MGSWEEQGVAKRSPLVSQHLENVSRDALVTYQKLIREYIRGREGVYALLRKGRLYYVGLAGNLRGRLTQHIRDRHGKSWDRFSVYLTIGDTHLRELESLVLRIAAPTGNKQKGKFARSENLRRRFRRDIKAVQDAERRSLLGEDARKADPKARRTKVAAVPIGARRPALSAYPERPKILRASFKGKTLRARVLRDGSIRFGKRRFNSPSEAAAVACKRISCNGWKFWKYERSPGDWVSLDALRRR